MHGKQRVARNVGRIEQDEYRAADQRLVRMSCSKDTKPGNRAAKNTMDFGFVTLARKSVSILVAGARDGASARSARPRQARQIRKSLPPDCRNGNVTGEKRNKTPSPMVAIRTWQADPDASPNIVIIAQKTPGMHVIAARDRAAVAPGDHAERWPHVAPLLKAQQSRECSTPEKRPVRTRLAGNSRAGRFI